MHTHGRNNLHIPLTVHGENKYTFIFFTFKGLINDTLNVKRYKVSKKDTKRRTSLQGKLTYTRAHTHTHTQDQTN